MRATPVANLGIGVDEDSRRRGFDRAMLQALQDLALKEGEQASSAR